MNKAILTGVALVATAASVCAQGTLAFTTASGAKPRITVNGVNAAPTDNIWVQVLVAGATGYEGQAASAFALTLSGANAGLFSKGALTVLGKAPGSTVDVTIRAWDKDLAATYEAATPGFFAASQTFSTALGGGVDANGLPILPGNINGFSGLNLVVPEPSTYALAALGLGGLLFLRRR